IRFQREYPIFAVSEVSEGLKEFFIPTQDNLDQYPELKAVREDNDIAARFFLYFEDLLLELRQPCNQASCTLAGRKRVAQNAGLVTFGLDSRSVFGGDVPPILFYEKRINFHVGTDVVRELRKYYLKCLHVPNTGRCVKTHIWVAV